MKEMTLGGQPVIITTESDGIYTPVKGRGCTVNIVSPDYLYDIYTAEPKGSPIIIFDQDGDTVLRGFVTPNIYNQDVDYLNEISIECTDALSILQYYDYKEDNELSGITSFYDILKYMLHDICGYKQLYFSRDIILPNDKEGNASEALKHLYISEGNFQNDDGNWVEENSVFKYEADRWKCNEVLEEICKFLNVSITIYHDKLYMINYYALDNPKQILSDRDARYFRIYDFTNDTVFTDSIAKERTLDHTDWKDGTPTISLSPTYSKIYVKDDTYEVDSASLIGDVWNADDLYTIGVYPWTGGWENEKIETFKLQNKKDGDVDNRVYYVMPLANRFWKQYEYLYIMEDKYIFEQRQHRTDGLYYGIEYLLNFLKIDNLVGKEEAPYYIGKGQASYDKYGFGSSGQVVNSIYYRGQQDFGGMLYKLFNWSEMERLKAKADWQNYMCLGTGQPMYANKTDINILRSSEKYNSAPFFEFKSKQTMTLNKPDKPTYILINGSVRYEDFYWCPLTDFDSKYTKAKTIEKTRANCCYRGLQMQIKVGDKYWHQGYYDLPYIIFENSDGSILTNGFWSTTPSRFYVPIAGEDGDANALYFNKDMSIFNTVTFDQGIGEAGYCIPINPDDDLQGQVEITMYVPYIYYNDDDFFIALDDSGRQTGEKMYRTGRWVTVSDLSIKYISDTQDWTDIQKPKTDVEFFNINEEQFTEELDAIELKINTQQKDKPLSLSSVLRDGGKQFVDTLHSHALQADQMQEKSIIEQQYEHYKDPKIQMEATLKGELEPYNVYKYPTLEREYNMYLDSYRYDLKNNETEATLEEF